MSAPVMDAANARPAKVFFGWWVVLASVVCIVVGYSSFVSVAFGLFIKSLEAEFGWSRMQLSYAGTLATGSIVVLAPIAGALTDRFGARRVLLPSLFLLGLVVASLALLNGSLVQFYLLVTLVAVAGMGTQPPVFSRMVVSWFDRQRGLALGISLAGVGLAGMVLPSILQPLIAGYGWRTAYVAFGLLVVCVAFPLAFFVMRDTPASMGLAPDGRTPDAASDAALLAIEREGLDVPAAMRDRAMWQMLVAFGLMGLVSAGFFIHLAPMVGERGFGMSAVALMLGLKGVAVVAGRVLCGLLVDRYFAPYIAGAFILCTAVGLALISGSTGLALSGFAVVLIGLGLGAEFDLMAFLISRYLGFRSYGRLYGIMYAVFGIGGAIGPVAVGLGYERFGSYGPGLMMLAAAPVIAALLLLLLGPYRYAAAGHGKPLPRGVVVPAARIGDAT